MGRKVLEPITIKKMELKNRIGFAPMLGNPCGPDFGVVDATMKWFIDRAKGDVAFSLTGGMMVSQFEVDFRAAQAEGGVFPPPLSIHTDELIPGYKRLTKECHEYDMKILAQLAIGGVVQGASAPPYPKDGFFKAIMGVEIPTMELTIEQIEESEEMFVNAAVRCQEAGFDGIGLHSAHGNVSLWGGFLSPFTNKRTDKYGGSWENRIRFAVETIEKTRKAVGEDFPILVRWSVDELYGPFGVTIEDSVKYIVPAFEKAGVDCFDVTMGSQLHNPNNIPSLYVPRGHYMYLAEAIKKASSVPVIGVGRILDMQMAEKFLEEGKCDIIFLGRQLIADPETPKKYFEGRIADIRKCIGDLPAFGGCCTCCAVNPTPPAMGPTDEVVPAAKPKRLLVIGGGVAGMEAARIATLRGHKVTLFEKEKSLGGKVDILANNPLNYEFRNLVEFLSAQLQKHKVDVRVCKEATAEEILALKPDVVILATGAELTVPKEARGKLNVWTQIDALKNIHTLGKRIVVHGLGYGSELAIGLAEMGKEVTLFGKGTEIASNVSALRRWFVKKRLEELNVPEGDGDIPETVKGNPKVMTGWSLVDIDADGVHIRDSDGNDATLRYDDYIVSLGRVNTSKLFEELEGKVPEMYKIGDADKTGEIYEAMKAAHDVSKQI